MGAILNGMALYGGFIPFGSTFLVFSDYMRPSIRLAALMGLRIIYVFTHDSLFVGEDGPTHQPVEHIAALRAITNLTVYRPADGAETALSWCAALRKTNGPTALCLSRQKLPEINRDEELSKESLTRGAYRLRWPSGLCRVILVASGSEVATALESRKMLKEKGIDAGVISMVSLDRFLALDTRSRERIIPSKVPLAVVEAGISQGWHAVTRAPMLHIGMNRYGASAPASVLAEKFGFTGEGVAEMVQCWLEDLPASSL